MGMGVQQPLASWGSKAPASLDPSTWKGLSGLQHHGLWLTLVPTLSLSVLNHWPLGALLALTLGVLWAHLVLTVIVVKVPTRLEVSDGYTATVSP